MALLFGELFYSALVLQNKALGLLEVDETAGAHKL